jgi:leader peptidase (prepilin peptidase) / N-methyltransferase
MMVALVALGAVLAGVVLSRAAVTLAPSDEGAEWRGRDRRFRIRLVIGVAVASAVSAAGAVLLAPTVPLAICAASFAGVGPGLAVVDVAVRRLPFLYTGIAAAVAVLALSFTPDLGPSLLTALVVAVVMVLLALVSNGGAGGGDVALAALAALTLAWAGWWAVVLALAAAMLLTGVAGLIARTVRGTAALPPFGPWMLAGWWLAFLLSTID